MQLGTLSSPKHLTEYAELPSQQLREYVDWIVAEASSRRLYAVAKRGLDIAVSLSALVLTFPLWLTIALLIKLGSPGPVLYKQTRMGRQAKPFACFKFRTMVDGADKILESDPRLAAAFSVSWKLRDDHRVTRVGKLLRRTSLDELPQLINVLRGEMSIVGPRPVQPRELEELYGPLAPVVTAVKPGLTSLWAVSGRSLVTYEERIALELEYVHRRGFAYDLFLIASTIPAVLSGRGAV